MMHLTFNVVRNVIMALLQKKIAFWEKDIKRLKISFIIFLDTGFAKLILDTVVNRNLRYFS